MWVYTVLLLTSVCLLSTCLGQKSEKTCKFKNKGKTYDVQPGEVTEIKKTKVNELAEKNGSSR